MLRHVRYLPLLIRLFSLLLAVPVQGDEPLQPGQAGIVALLDVNGIGVIDPRTHQIHGPFLNDGSLGAGGVIDAVVTPDGLVGIVSNFADATVHFIDLSTPLQPRVYASLVIDFFAEDLALTPDGQWLLVTDGGLASKVAVIHVPSTRHVSSYNLGSHDAQAVCVAPDGTTVLLADYLGGNVHVMTLDTSTGQLTLQKTLPIQEYLGVSMDFWPTNIVVSPDGRTALVTNAFRTGTHPDYTHGSDPAVLRIDGPGEVEYIGMAALASTSGDGQSAVFSADGHFIYLLCVNYNPSTDEPGPIQIVELEVLAPGSVKRTGRVIPLQRNILTGSFFGVDTLSWAGTSNRYLYASNSGSSNPTRGLSVVDLNWFEQVALMETPGVPVGLSFAQTAGGSGADLAVGLSLSAASVPVDTELTATVTVTNPGPGTATNIIISSPVHRTWPLVAYQASHGGYEPGCHRWVIPNLPAGATATLTLTVTAPTPMTDVLEARLLGMDGVDPNASNNVGTAPITITAAGSH